MLARNPKTGGQIRIMRSDVSIHKNRKTLVWMKEPFVKSMAGWSVWDTVIVGVDPGLLAWNPAVVVLDQDLPEYRDWVKTPAARKVRFIFLTTKLVDTLAAEEFDVTQLGNVIGLEEYSSMYPFVGPAWDGTAEDAIVSAAVIFRYDRLVGLDTKTHPRMAQLEFDNVKLKLYESCEAPEPLVLIQQYYKPKDSKRAKELAHCLEENLKCPYIDTIYLFMESNEIALPADPSNKIVKIPLKSRLTFADCVQLVEKVIGPGKLVAFANADIYLDSTWKSFWSIDLRDTFVALLRWEEGVNGAEHTIFGPRADSQDTWLVHSDSVVSRTWNLESLKIPFGKAGCDNTIPVEFLRQKFKIVNPAASIRTIHVHTSEFRTYDKKDVVDKPVYMYIEPTGIHELNAVTTWEGWAGATVPHDPLDRPLKATNPKMLGLFCSQMNRDPSFVWSADGTNTYLAPVGQDRPVEMKGGVFVGPNGLVFRHSDICVGPTDSQKMAWSNNSLSHLLPAHKVEEMLAFPLESDWVHDPAMYVLCYLSKVITQFKKTPEASYWCKRTEGLLSAVKLFNWGPIRGRLLEYDEQTQVFAKVAYGRTSHGVRIMPEDIESLRSNKLVEWQPVPNLETRAIVIVADTQHIKDELMDALELASKEACYDVRIIWNHSNAAQWAEALSGVSRVILSSSLKNIKTNAWAWLWMAPKGCKILELQEEREASDSLVHLSAAAGLDWTLLQYPRSTPEGFRKIILKEFGKWLALDEPISKPVLPIVYTPPKSMKHGFFGHAGDSFRELLDMWAERAYVNKKEDPAITHCWLNGVGADGVLLYDRPTWNWLEKSSEKEQSYKACLAANPDPSEKPNAKPWIFWARNPRMVEETVARVGLRGYMDRTDRLVFFGRVENPTQGQYRQDISGWAEICTHFSMPVGAKEPYKLGPQEYLDALANSKYGLCLRGYGPKCNREIEVLAMGCVPVVVGDVDTQNYANPLVEGVHYIRVANPEDAQEKMTFVDETKWAEMSRAGQQWWKENCSAEGSWSVTKSLIAIHESIPLTATLP